ncbi:alpha/beta fold hydrolase [Variovorax saccharolyticus]|uniref:alpha/beta fold hydrolase n=1 Tax=Variovorax saccharolyticus TaxID=3053516 RepID=UPI00257825FC|nr:alpha/beta hydrolase [Variovorax sp. J22R187]MDM0021032.1 alpha/beta hydrolase [Variovorax sp. J22R187]
METWVLLRGLTRESAHWGRFPEQLRGRLPGARVLAIDIPGNGRLWQVQSPDRIEATTESCRQQLRALGIEPPYRLLAMSLGAMIAVDWADRHPGELDGCVLINTSLRGFSPWYRRLRPASYGTLLSLLLSADPARREQQILQLTSSHPPAAMTEAIDAWTAIRKTRPVSGANALRQLLAAMRYRAPARAPAVPLLVLVSRRDALVDARCSLRLAHEWKASLGEHPSAGHDLPLDDGCWVAEQVAAHAFFSRQ